MSAGPSGRSRASLATTTCAFVLLSSIAANAQIVANGKSLTVTTANAVATFNGPDLVGLGNALTAETYLKKPSNGDLVRVDTIVPTGQSLQTSNWTVGTEPGTGVPLATITAQDAARTFTLTVKIDAVSQEIVLRSSASTTSGGLRGASWSIAGLDLQNGRWIVPAKSGVVFDRDHLGLNTYLEYPFSWHAQMAVYEAAQGCFLLYSTDGQYAFKQLRQTSRADYMVDVGVFTEAEAPWPSASSVPVVEWRLKAYLGDWRAAAQTFRTWMLNNRPPVPNTNHPWVANIRTVVGIGSGNQDTSLLTPLAAQVNPTQTLLYLIDWRKTGYDINYPDYTPAPNTAAFITAAHALGFKVMLHTDLVGVAPDNADYPTVQAYQTRTSEALQPMGWNWDKPPSTPQRYAIINPASSAFRALWIARVGAAIAAVNPDALHLDFNGIYNDGNGRIGGLTFPQGDVQFHSEIVSAFPSLALGGELQSDIDYRFYSFAQAGLDMAYVPAPGHPIVTFLFSPQTLTYGHLSTPNVTGMGPVIPSLMNGRFKAALLEDQRRAVFPLRNVYSTGDLDTGNADIARFVGVAQSWQNNAWSLARTADWTGTLIRYLGNGGATAALTDSGQLLQLSSPVTPIFQIVHDTNQLATGSFIDRWPAFDTSTLYGLDPTRPYYLDSLPRPDSTHATSLPPGVRVGTGTRISTSFAHVELEGAAPFDFNDLTLPHARIGVAYQGTDFPAANGAVANLQNTTVGGQTRLGIFIHPPWQAQLGGETFVEYLLPVPPGAALRFSVGIDDGASCTDGVAFRVTVGGTELWHRDFDRGAWHDGVVSLAAYAGTTVPLRLISNPGPAANANCDWSSWTNVALVAASPGLSIPLTLGSGSAFAGIDGATYSSASSSSGTVTTTGVPGAFTIFTQAGTAVADGTNLAALPFETWQWITGELAYPGTIFSAGSVGTQTAGGVTKSPAIFAHPPNPGRTVLSWVVRLPVSPLQLRWSAGVMDGANSSDGVDFEVRVNGQPYWQLTDGANGVDRWTSGSLDLSRWSGQSILIELMTDSRGEINFDWAAWADLVLSPSAVSCSYGVPASASATMFGGTLTANVTASTSCPWSAASNVPWLRVITGSGSGSGRVSYEVAPNPGTARTGTLTIAGQTMTVTQAAGLSLPTMTLDRGSLFFTGVTNGASFVSQTGAQAVRLTQTGAGTVTWTATSDVPWLTVSPASGTGTATLNISVGFQPGLTARQTGKVTVSFSGAGNITGPISVTLDALSQSTTAVPFGSFDTPDDGATGIAGSIAITGWALDDVEVTRVTVCRDASGSEAAAPDANCGGQAKVYIGDAVLVEGARPDVQAGYPALPVNTRAGWGYLLLSNFLPNLGNGTFVLRAYAYDADGHTTLLGSKQITCSNATSAAPFGAIDVPGQGAVVSGVISNIGWVLAPAPAFADPPDGGTVHVFVDGIDLGDLNPGLWTTRSDLQELFSPAKYPGIDTALGVHGIDTTTLTNGVHTIFWIVTGTGSSGAAGIGSRFFTVSNGTPASVRASNVIESRATLDVPRAVASRLSSPNTLPAEVAAAPVSATAIRGRRGFDLERPLRDYFPSRGWIDVQAEELDRVELHLAGAGSHQYAGYLRTSNGLAPLPVGSTLDPATGVYTWMPGVGFHGAYELTFVDWSNGHAASRQDVRLTLNAKGSNRVGPQTTVDVPTPGARADGTFVVAGWAADLDSAVDSGVSSVQVWAYPLDDSGNRLAPVLIGPATYGLARPDVAEIYGNRFRNSGYGIVVNTLPPGAYDIAVFGYSTVVNSFTPARVARVVVR